METAQVYFVARGPGNEDTAPYGTKVPFINSQDPGLKKYTSLNSDAWLGARFETSDAEPPAKESESTDALPTAASNDEDNASDAESLSDAESTESTRDAAHNRGKTRAGRKIVPP